jgi:hypothetical protein
VTDAQQADSKRETEDADGSAQVGFSLTLRTTLIAAGAALLGAIIGLAGTVLTTFLTSSHEREAENLRIARESCAEFITSAVEVDLRLNAMWLISLYQPPTPRSDYIERMDDLRTNAIPVMYGKQAVLQLSTRSVDVSYQSNEVIGALVKQINYVSETIGRAPDIAPSGLIESQKISEFDAAFKRARNALLDSCARERSGFEQ